MQYVAIFEYNTDADGIQIPPDTQGPITIHGPFESEQKAMDWLIDQPYDPDCTEAIVAPLNDPKDR